MPKKDEMLHEDQIDTKIYNPTKKRSCTDVLCLLLFLVFLGGWVAISVIAVQQGNPEIIVYPSNSSGEVCGRGENTDKPNLLFHDLTSCYSIESVLGCPTPQVCVEECPKETTSLWACLLIPNNKCEDLLESYRKYCVPMTDEQWNTEKQEPKKLMLNRLCPTYTLASIPVIGRCVPDFGIIENLPSNESSISSSTADYVIENIDGELKADSVFQIIKYLTELLNAREFAEKVWADLISSWYWILGGLLLSMAVSFLWILLMRFIPGPMIYISMFCVMGLLGLSTAYSWIKYSSMEDSQEGEGFFDVNPITDDLSTYLAIKDTWLVFFILSVSMLIILALILLVLRSRVNLAVALISESSKAVSNIMSSLFFPVFPFLFQLAVVAFFCLVAAFLASTSEQQFVVAHECSGGPRNGERCEPSSFQADASCPVDQPAQCIFYKFSPSDTNNYLQIYNIFALFWGLFFASAFGEMILSGGFSSWYWAMDKYKDVPTFTLLASLYRTVRYHLGTIAFGSLIIAIIRMIRLVLMYIKRKVDEEMKGIWKKIAKVILCLFSCFFWCLEKFLKFINRNAYIITASYGHNFCMSAKLAFKLILNNMARVAVLDKVTDFLLFLGKLVVVGIVGVCSYYVFSGGLNDKVPLELESPKLNYFFVPVILITLSAYMIASCFFSVFSMAVDTVFLCVLLDIEKNKNESQKQYHMSKNLWKILNLKKE